MAAARKLKLSQSVQIVPQVGHDAPLAMLSFHPEEPRRLAALDLSPALRVWHVEYGDVLFILPLPPGRYDALWWTGDASVAVRVAPDPGEQQQPPQWLHVDLTQPARLKPTDAAPAPWPDQQPKPFATVHPAHGPCVLFPDAPPQRLFIPRRPLGMLADPLGRYAIDWDAEGVSVYSATHGRQLGRFNSRGVRAVAIDPGGAFAVLATEQGDIVRFDPVRPETLRLLGRLSPEPRSVAISPDGQRVAVGGADFGVTVFNAADGQVVMSSGRAPFGFSREVALREQIGFAALRGETLCAYLDEHERFLHTVAMPSACEALAPSTLPNAVFAASRGGSVYELDLRKLTVTAAFEAEGATLRHLDVTTPDRVFAALDAGGDLLTHHSGRLTRFDLSASPWDPDAVTSFAAASHNGAPTYVAAAAGADGSVQVRKLKLSASKRSAAVSHDLPGINAHALAFIQHQGDATLIIIDAHCVLWRLNVAARGGVKANLRRVGLLSAPPGHLPLARALAATTDRDGSLRVLFSTQNLHRLLLLVDPAAAETHFLAGWISVGQQVSDIYDESGHWLRDPETATVRMVAHLYPHSAEEWSRALTTTDAQAD